MIKQTVTSDLSILVGVSLQKATLPPIIQALSKYLLENGLNLPAGPLLTLYRVELHGNVYF